MKTKKHKRTIGGLSERHVEQLIGIQMTEQVMPNKTVYNRKKEPKIRVNNLNNYYDEEES